MNCKPNQRAIVTRTLGVLYGDAYLGLVFTVRHVHHESRVGPMWLVDPDNMHPLIRGLGPNKPITVVADAVLTPLPDDPDPVEQDTREIEHA